MLAQRRSNESMVMSMLIDPGMGLPHPIMLRHIFGRKDSILIIDGPFETIELDIFPTH